jgi:F420-dependent oxidoreductase-like protein
MMLAISVMIEGQDGLNWPRWQRIVEETEALGFAGLFRSDHYTNGQPPDLDSLEMIVSLAYVAGNTKRIHFGPLVAPFSFREPAMLARQAAALDDLSGGRMILGLGAGWQEREHTLFGHDLGDLRTRMDRFEEGLHVTAQLLRSDEPVWFEGRFYQLRGATLLPRPQRPGGARILIGGTGPTRTLPLTARYADIWNATSRPPEQFRALSARLDDLARKIGRDPKAIRRTLMLTLHYGRDEAALERQVGGLRERVPELAGKPLDAVLGYLQAEQKTLAGSADDVLAQIRAYADAGVDELMVRWLDLGDLDGLRAFAEEVLPNVGG